MWRSVLGLGAKSGLRTGLRAGPGLGASTVGGRAASRSVFAFSNRRLASTLPKQGPQEKMTLKKLVKEYGWTATGVYCVFMCIDLPLCYLLVHSVGQENMEQMESRVRKFIGVNSDRDSTYIHKAAAGGKSLFVAEFAIAYILHKALIVVRVPLTIAVTPAVATKLQQWGFNVNRVMPSVDKSKLAAKAADVNSPTVRKAAEAIASREHKPVDAVAKDLASKAGRAAESGKNAIAETAEKREPRNFGKPADKKKRWWWFF